MSQSLAQIYLHIVFSTKERRPLLSDPQIRGLMHSYLVAACRNVGSASLQVGGVEDHVHVLCLLSRTLTVSSLVRELKRQSSKRIKSEEGMEDFAWQAGYGAFSVSPTQVDRVMTYIRHQEKHHRKIDFQDELRRLLKKNRVEFDEAEIWT